MMESLYVIAQIAGERVALPARDVESVMEIDEIVPVPLAPGHVAGLAALRSRVLTVVDARRALGLETPPHAGVRTALVCACEGHLYGLLVDAVEDVIDLGGIGPVPLPASAAGGWGQAAAGLITMGADVLLLLDVASLLRGSVAAHAA